jgi:hypothetical protein
MLFQHRPGQVRAQQEAIEGIDADGEMIRMERLGILNPYALDRLLAGGGVGAPLGYCRSTSTSTPAAGPG